MNLIPNATGLDGVTGYGSNPGGLTVDDAVRGAPNRLAIVGNVTYLHTPPADVEGLAFISAATAFDGPAGTSGAGLEFYGPASFYSFVPMTTPRSPRGSARRGIAATFGRVVALAVAVPPAATTAQIVTLSGPGSVSPRALFRPQINEGSTLQCWRPGEHLNPDLALPAFPAIEPERDGFAVEPVPIRKSFAGDAGIPTSRRVAASSRRYLVLEYALDAIGRDVLDSFWRANHSEFWFVRPDNGDLVIAEWADDGDPKDTGAGASRRTMIRLLTRDS
jgi:hypothetical protein